MTERPERTCLAFDPSPTGFAYGFVRQKTGRAFERIETGDVDRLDLTNTRNTILDLYDRMKPDVCAVESVAGFLSTKRLDNQFRKDAMDIQSLVDTALFAGIIAASLPDPASVVLMPANNKGKSLKSWRYHLTGRPTSGDDAVTAALNVYLIGKLPVKSHRMVSESPHNERKMQQTVYRDNVHKRDALGLAIVALLVTS
jgi:hypothetical protein